MTWLHFDERIRTLVGVQVAPSVDGEINNDVP